ncbi:hypothetical protein SKAU_G00027050 [Synaphobranchus kaupii]|uniref:Uncharacterized protein n=1 Tax=Synaphobranchus kaupii TaxID=118154 RepID=A0A9Q1JF39_SYNKA|nr:hypothetical protein SKAU_G00027050 [Synaphobranchus kaupii]
MLVSNVAQSGCLLDSGSREDCTQPRELMQPWLGFGHIAVTTRGHISALRAPSPLSQRLPTSCHIQPGPRMDPGRGAANKQAQIQQPVGSVCPLQSAPPPPRPRQTRRAQMMRAPSTLRQEELSVNDSIITVSESESQAGLRESGPLLLSLV